MITHQPKTFEAPNIVDIKSFNTEHQNLQKLSKTIRQAEKVGSNSFLYVIQKIGIFFKRRKM